MNDNDITSDTQSLIAEYQSAQDSAQHHDNQVWDTTGIIWAAGLVLFGFVIQSLDNQKLKLPIIIVCILAIIMLLYLWVMALQLNSVKNQKYERCKELEAILHFEQHSKLRYAKYSGRIFYAMVMITFIAAWILTLIIALTS